MRLNNYRGMVNDRPIDTVVVEPTVAEASEALPQRPNFMDHVRSHLNSQGTVPAGNLPIYDKG
jgi:hypothetical protein